MQEFIAAIDQGTTSTRCIIFNRDGKIIGIDQKEHNQIFPQPGWVEHDPLEIWHRAQEVFSIALNNAGISAEQINAIGITNQRETTIIWDKTTGRPLYNAIVWQDTRTDTLCSKLANEGGQDRFRLKTGLPLATYFSGLKIKWILENIPEARRAAFTGNALFGNIDTWLIWNLTGGIHGGKHITDVTNASRTMLMNLETLNWDPEILSTLDIPYEMLPNIVSSSELYGFSHIENARVPIAGNLGDQQAALFGQTCFSPGEAKNTYGTGCFMLINTGNKPVVSKFGLLTTLGYKIGNADAVYCLEGSIAIAGALIQWLRDNLQIIQKSADVETLAASVEDNGGIYFVPAFSGLYAPYWQNNARGAIIGMTRFVSRGHIARAALEATAFQTREVLEAMEKDSGVQLKTLKVDGGMVFNNLLMQFQADILNVPVVRPLIAETTALGAAYAAGLATGYWKDQEDLRKNWYSGHTWYPAMQEEMRSRLYQQWKKAVTRTFDWLD